MIARIVVKRILDIVPTMFILVTTVFFLIKIAPGGPFDNLGDFMPQVVIDNLKKTYNLDKDLLSQYLGYIKNLCFLDLGMSYFFLNQEVSQLIWRHIPASMLIGSLTLFISLFLGILMGVLSLLYRHGFVDRVLSLVAGFFSALPGYLLAPFLMEIFCMIMPLLPLSGYNSWENLVLPVVSLALPLSTLISRLVRANMIKNYQEPYIKTAMSKGVSHRRIVLYHLLRPALLSVLGVLGQVTTFLLMGSLVVEITFSIPGLGRLSYIASSNRDYTLMMGIIILYGFTLLMCNLVIDLAYCLFDPKIKSNIIKG